MKTFLTALVMGLSGASAVFISASSDWPTWVLFIAWVSYYLFGRTLKSSANSFLLILMGIIMGIAIQSIAALLIPTVGQIGFPLTVFVLIGSLNYIAKIKLFSNIPGWFLGLIIFFGVHPELKPLPILELLIPIVAGFVFAIINDTGIKYISNNILIKE